MTLVLNSYIIFMQIKGMSKPTCPLPLAFDTFSRLFKKELGISVSDYIREKKSHQKLRLPRLLCRFSTLTGTIYIPCLQIRVVLHREYISRMVNTDLMPVSSCCDSLPKSCVRYHNISKNVFSTKKVKKTLEAL